MTGWTLILYIYAGVLAPDNSVALTHIQGFKTEMNCWAAGAAARSLVKDSLKDLRFVCIKQE